MNNYLIEKNTVQSVLPATAHFGFTYWADMIPPFKPKTVLILGYGYGTLTDLIRKVWGKKPVIWGIDLVEYKKQREPNIFLQGNAEEIIKTLNPPIEYIAIDIFDGNKIPDFVFEEDFVKNIAALQPKLISLNTIGIFPTDEKIHAWEKEFHTPFWKQNSNGNTIYFFTPTTQTFGISV